VTVEVIGDAPRDRIGEPAGKAVFLRIGEGLAQRGGELRPQAWFRYVCNLLGGYHFSEHIIEKGQPKAEQPRAPEFAGQRVGDDDCGASAVEPIDSADRREGVVRDIERQSKRQVRGVECVARNTQGAGIWMPPRED
jgi:hypothetical protein